MTDLEIKIITTIRENPKAMDMAIDILDRMETGESIESIAASYGVKCDSTNQVAQETKDDHSK